MFGPQKANKVVEMEDSQTDEKNGRKTKLEVKIYLRYCKGPHSI